MESSTKALHKAIQAKDLSLVREAVEKLGADVELRDPIKDRYSLDSTPLHRACRVNSLDIVRYLVCTCGAYIG